MFASALHSEYAFMALLLKKGLKARRTHFTSAPGLAITIRMSRTVSPVRFFWEHRPTHKIVVERLFPTLATFSFVWSCRLKEFTKTVLGNCWPNKAEMAVNGNTSQMKTIKCALTVKKKKLG